MICLALQWGERYVSIPLRHPVQWEAGLRSPQWGIWLEKVA